MHKSSSKSKSRRWGDWSDWIWSSEYQRYYRQRQDANGVIDTEWDQRTAADDQTPRDLEGITEGIANLQTSSSSSYDSQNSEYAVTSGGSRSRSSKSHKSSSRSNGKQPAYSEDGDDTEREDSGSDLRYHAPHAAVDGTQYYDTNSRQYYSYSTDQPTAQHHQSTAAAYNTSAASGYGYPATATAQYDQGDYSQVDEDAEFQRAVADSRNYNYSTSAAGEASASAYSAYEYDEEGPPTPKVKSSHIAATSDGLMEQLDPRYRVEHSHRFQPGEIFKVLWSEPQGTGNDGAPSVSERHEFRDKFGGKFFVGFRRFVVIANDQGHCTCVPILTYGGKGCKKRGVKPEKHGIIYERGQKAKLLSGEPKLGFAPAKVDITMEGEKLSKESRVNYSKLVTVEHNVKVFFIGNVTPSDWEIVSEAVNRCWEEKIHHKKKHFK